MDFKTQYQAEQHVYQETIEFINKFVPPTTLYKKNPDNLLAIPEFRALANAVPGILCIIDFPNRGYVFMSDNSKALIGYEPEVFYQLGLKQTIGLFTREQCDIILHKIFPLKFECIERQSKEGNVKDFRFTFDSLIKNADNTVSWYLHQMTILETDESGMPILMLKLVTDINDIKRDNNMTFTISKKNSMGRYEPIFSETYLPKTERENLSSREVEILRLIGQGKTSKEIADLLFISIHTVNTHRKNMMKKMKTKNIPALIKTMSNSL